jgi:hypothetical protein
MDGQNKQPRRQLLASLLAHRKTRFLRDAQFSHKPPRFRNNRRASPRSWQAAAQPFDSALPKLRMNRAIARFTSSAPTDPFLGCGPRGDFFVVTEAHEPQGLVVAGDAFAQKPHPSEAEGWGTPACIGAPRARALELRVTPYMPVSSAEGP